MLAQYWMEEVTEQFELKSFVQRMLFKKFLKSEPIVLLSLNIGQTASVS